MSEYLKNFIRFWLLVLLQIVLLNKISLRWWSAYDGHPIFLPYLYPLFILLLPFETPVWLLLLLAMGMGLTMDAFMNTMGMHALALVLVAYLRTNVLVALLPKNLGEYHHQSPNTRVMGWLPFLTYCLFLLFIHHFVFFMVERWPISNFGMLMLTILASTVTTMLMVVAYVLLFTKQIGRSETR